MRSFIVAIIILSCVFAFTTFDCIYTDKSINELLSVCEKMQHGSSPMLTDELKSKWEDCRSIISLTTRQSDIELAENAILSLEHYLDVPADYNTQLALLKKALEHIRASHTFSLESIF